MKNHCYLLTIIKFLNYSERMDADLKVLEEKLAKLLALYGDVRVENEKLRQSLSVMESDTALLKANMAQASARIEALMQRLP